MYKLHVTEIILHTLLLYLLHYNLTSKKHKFKTAIVYNNIEPNIKEIACKFTAFYVNFDNFIGKIRNFKDVNIKKVVFREKWILMFD